MKIEDKIDKYLNENIIDKKKLKVDVTEKPGYSNSYTMKFEITFDNKEIGTADISDITRGRGTGQMTLNKNFAKEYKLDMSNRLLNAKANKKFIKDTILQLIG